MIFFQIVGSKIPIFNSLDILGNGRFGIVKIQNWKLSWRNSLAMKKDIIPLLVAIILVFISIGMNLFRDIALDGTLYIGIGWLSVASFFYFLDKKIYLFAFGATLLAGLFSLIDIYYVSLKFEVGFFLVNPIFIVLIFGFILLNRDGLKTLLAEMPKLKGK
jgi:hypothetical protein